MSQSLSLNNITDKTQVFINVTGGNGFDRITVNSVVGLKELNIPDYSSWSASNSSSNSPTFSMADFETMFAKPLEGATTVSQVEALSEKMKEMVKNKVNQGSKGSYDSLLRDAVVDYLVKEHGFTLKDDGAKSKIIRPQDLSFNLVSAELGSDVANITAQLQAAYGLS